MVTRLHIYREIYLKLPLWVDKEAAAHRKDFPRPIPNGSTNLLSQWQTFWTFGDSIFSRENKVQTFFSGSIG